MPKTYSQIYIQIVFTVQNTNALIQEAWEEKLNNYLTGIINNKNQLQLHLFSIQFF